MSPFPACEPKSNKARMRVEQRNPAAAHHEATVKLIKDALGEIRSCFNGDWSISRALANDKASCPDLTSMAQNLALLQAAYGFDAICEVSSSSEPIEDISDIYARPCSNKSTADVLLTFTLGIQLNRDLDAKHSFWMPPNSSFVLSKIGDLPATSLLDLVRRDEDHRFDFILLDPPWPNASVRRSSSYSQCETLYSLRGTLLDLPIRKLLSSNGIVAIWLTNSNKVRKSVLEKEGLFEKWGVTLFEEWIWVKVTGHGEPTVDLGGVWRRPYEMLLLAKKSLLPGNPLTRRTIVAAPTVHSQKPCLRSLITPFMPNEYQALEIFARNLVSGWTSWGDEVLKYNWEGFWALDDGAEEASVNPK
ncbi:MAG: hypothetical protein M1814_006645 [Vezdaea aestivalis]|nr:MAG: hypothetical protein M1814_006645 [Vezdaea aestivalis]